MYYQLDNSTDENVLRFFHSVCLENSYDVLANLSIDEDIPN